MRFVLMIATFLAGPVCAGGMQTPLSEKVQSCWNTGALSSAALRLTLQVAFDLDQQGELNSGTIRLVSATGGSGGAVEQAFQAARRAIIRCGADGYDEIGSRVLVFGPDGILDITPQAALLEA
ncbi:MAG: hypothetical protein ACU0CF_04640 [Sagittula sp.]|uniref:hypothetical protein n=1 Tax=Sagittula sp. TaxID=2038081 RepID=UPI004057F456